MAISGSLNFLSQSQTEVAIREVSDAGFLIYRESDNAGDLI